MNEVLQKAIYAARVARWAPVKEQFLSVPQPPVPEPPPAIDWRAKYYELLATFQSRARVKIDPMAGLRTERPRAADIIRIVAAHHHLSVNDIVGHYRAQKFVLARQVAVHLTKKLTLLSLPQIGKAFNGRDHTTIIHALKKIAQKLEQDSGVREEIAFLEGEALKTVARLLPIEPVKA